jgi:hypothetical protein
VLFSQERVADFINQSFEPVWESVRPVPIVHIDFGNGKVLTRTLHGNILTSICTPDGFVVDALPGIYTESVYVERLRQICSFASGIGNAAAEKRDLLRVYHREQIEALAKQARVPAGFKFPDPSKTVVIEAPVIKLVQANNNIAVPSAIPPQVDNPAEWKALQEDTQVNESIRRRQIHELLARSGLVTPDKVTRPIYKDVLHADLDDPYLGLGEVLLAGYPFAKEDAAH